MRRLGLGVVGILCACFSEPPTVGGEAETSGEGESQSSQGTTAGASTQSSATTGDATTGDATTVGTASESAATGMPGGPYDATLSDFVCAGTWESIDIDGILSTVACSAPGPGDPAPTVRRPESIPEFLELSDLVVLRPVAVGSLTGAFGIPPEAVAAQPLRVSGKVGCIAPQGSCGLHLGIGVGTLSDFTVEEVPLPSGLESTDFSINLESLQGGKHFIIDVWSDVQSSDQAVVLSEVHVSSIGGP